MWARRAEGSGGGAGARHGKVRQLGGGREETPVLAYEAAGAPERTRNPKHCEGACAKARQRARGR
jgi:hypothetical protein